MRKNYFLFFILLPFLGISQGSINFDDDAKWIQGGGGTVSLSSYSDHSYSDGVFTATGVDILRNTTSDQDGYSGALGTYSVRLRNNATTQLTMTIASGGVGTFSFKVRRWDSSPDTNFTVEYSTDEGNNWINSSTINASITTDSDWKTVEGQINSTNSNIQVRIVSNGTTERIMVDDFSWTSPGSTPSLLISSPSDGASYNPTISSVDVTLSVQNFDVANGTGDGHIVYTINAGSENDKYDTSAISVPVSTGNSYTVYVELVDNSGNPLLTPVNATVNFSVASISQVSTLTALRNGTEGEYYEFTGEAIISYARSSRNQKYIEDNTVAVAKSASGSGILIDDSSGIITSTYNQYDGISGLKGQLVDYYGVLEFVPIEDPGSASSTGNTITPEEVTLTELSTNWGNYESELVKIKGVTFADGDGSTTFSSSTNYDISDGSTTITFRTLFSEADYIGQLIPSGSQDIVVLVGEYNGTPQVAARDLADMTATLGISRNAIEGFSVFPNPVNNGKIWINTQSNATKQVKVFDILGKQLISTDLVEREFNISKLTSGIYILKVVQEGKIATRKLVVK